MKIFLKIYIYKPDVVIECPPKSKNVNKISHFNILLKEYVLDNKKNWKKSKMWPRLNKSPKGKEKWKRNKREIKVQRKKGKKSPNRKGKIKFQIKIGKSKLELKKKVIPKTTM